ncbi:NADH dehydrogenase [ubiquinone] 1 alpha subcomplex subunit 1-like [Dermacentor silvarum]|uniref:NADH dehydrogenase [ubiquinone] 1 alpha subcomplex subunit 1-like n=1 Tax=Dermacentor silvarum TaxID=543639 RepID=UPI0018991BDC|nr:NADH dehydrogenase [ubiquinone] 1 alpha subcomplex subunit 1-like [Dermacentor silvarum]
MWFEILPSVAIIGVLMSIPNLTVKPISWLYDGKPYRRVLCDVRSREDAMRDERLSGHIYTTIGLEGIPDEPEKK